MRSRTSGSLVGLLRPAFPSGQGRDVDRRKVLFLNICERFDTGVATNTLDVQVQSTEYVLLLAVIGLTRTDKKRARL